MTSDEVAEQAAQGLAPGHPQVDDALSRLHDAAGAPLDEQVEILTDVHQRLAAALADS